MSLQHAYRSLHRFFHFGHSHSTASSSPPSCLPTSSCPSYTSYLPDPKRCPPLTPHSSTLHRQSSTNDSSNITSIIWHNEAMDIFEMREHYSSSLKLSETPRCLRQERSPLAESLKRKSTAAVVFPPLSLSISITNATQATATATPLFLSSSSSSSLSATSSAASSSSSLVCVRSSTRHVPYYASCFSPLDLPSDIFVCLLQYLSPGDLWRLCQVSRAMQKEVIGFMSRIQHFKYSAARILHQEHSDPFGTGKGGWPELSRRGLTFYDRMTFGEASAAALRTSFLLRAGGNHGNNSSTSNNKSPGQIQSRSSYWLSQARFLVATIREGTHYELALENSPEKRGACAKASLELRAAQGRISSVAFSAPSSTEDLSTIDQNDSHAPSASSSASSSSRLSASHMAFATMHPTLPTTVATTTTSIMSLDPSSLHSQDLKPTPDPLPMDRFSAMVDLIFDPNIVRLNHRRAIINCARYVSASIDESFLKAVSTHDPQDPDFHILFQRQHTVDLGPYLIVTSPVHYNSDGSAFSSRDQALVDAGRDHLRSTRISPPRRMHNYFQAMLWHRCMNDLISLFNRVQRRHVETTEALGAPEGQRYFEASEACRMCSAALSSITSGEAVYCQHHHHQAEPLAAKTTAVMPDIYPFCCKAHSLVFSSQYPLSFVPYPLRVQIRRVVQKVQSVSRKSIWTTVFDSITNLTGNNNSNNSSSNASYHSSDNSNSHYSDRMTTRGSTIQYTGPTRKLQFCSDAAHSYSHSHSHSTFSPSGKQSTKGDDEEELIQRRYRIEERIRQDNLEKQELLSLCHMACGLFLSDDQSLDAPPTIMSLLRQGSPWNRGVWSEGEWLHSPIDVYPQRHGHTPCKSGSSSQKDENWSDSQSQNQSSKVDTMDMGCWQRVCIETIQFLAHEDLAWGGNRTNAELSRLRASSNASAWIYHE